MSERVYCNHCGKPMKWIGWVWFCPKENHDHGYSVTNDYAPPAREATGGEE